MVGLRPLVFEDLVPKIKEHQAVQTIARNVLVQLGASLSPLDSERSIAIRAERMLASYGITQTWYYSCPALVLAGPRTCFSLSGKDYVPADDEIGPTNLVTVDLSPSVDGVWGDCARSFFLEQGNTIEHPRMPEWVCGQEALNVLHSNLQEIATPDMTFGDLCNYASSQIELLGFRNLDFLGNVGHTIESNPTLRCYIESGNPRLLGSADMFTFEPHIQVLDGSWGFKHEEIYYFHDRKLKIL